MSGFAIPPAALAPVAVSGGEARLSLRRIFCVGRDHAAHARGTGRGPDREPPFFHSQPANDDARPDVRGRGVGRDLTRGDLGASARKAGRPRARAKGGGRPASSAPIRPAAETGRPAGRGRGAR